MYFQKMQFLGVFRPFLQRSLGYYVAISHDLSVLADDAFLIAIGSDFRRTYDIMPCPNRYIPSRLCRLGKVGSGE